MSFMYKMKSNGPRTGPCGTPYLTGRLLDKYSFSCLFSVFKTFTCCALFLR
jgi:hypothetical protein